MANEPSDGNDKDRNAPTVRDLKEPEVSGDTVPDIIGLYVPPRPLPGAAEHRTLDLRSVRLSDQADPRRALTQRRLVSPPKRRAPRYLPAVAAVIGLLALGGAGWFFLHGRALREPSNGMRPARPPGFGATSPTTTITIAPIAPLRSEPSKPSVSNAPPDDEEPAMDEEPTADEDSAPDDGATAPSRSPRPRDANRDANKKRKDPWLE